jgi:cytochrome c-type biogenesis protein CcmH/NrfG
MAKKQLKKQQTAESKPQANPIEPVHTHTETMVEVSWVEKLTSGFIPYVIILLFSGVLYANTLSHQFALDDDIVICKNEYVLRGISGMSDIFSKDLFDSFYKQMNTTAQLSGGRYRPLSVATFAIEQEFIGTRENANFEPNSWDFNKNGKQDIEEDINKDGIWNDKDTRSKGFTLRHFDNMLFYGIACCVLFLFLSTVVFRSNKLLALIVSLLFLAHPIHTEVVANVKSRDEIFSFLFMMLTLYLAHRYELKKNIKLAILASLSFFAAMLSKEYGATLLILVPLSLYLFSTEKFEIKRYIPLLAGMALMFIIYYSIRSGIVIGKSNLQDKELLNNPYLLADETQQLATKLYIFLKYFITQLFPHPLSSDYGYNSIPYKDFSDPLVWVSILLLLGFIVGGLFALRKKHWLAFAIAFYMLTILLVTNLVFNVGATMGERLVFHSSLGYCMGLGFVLVWLGQKFKSTQLSLLLALPILLLYSIKTISRNKAWENDITLALTDVEIMPESTALNGNAASRNLDLSEWPKNKPQEKQLIRKSIQYGKKALQLHPKFVNGYLNLGLAYAKLEMYDSAKVCWDVAFAEYPSHPNKQLYYNLLADAYYRAGYKLGGEQKWKDGAAYLQMAVNMAPNNAQYWYDLGGFSFNSQDYVKAKEAWTKAYQLNPKDTNIIKVQSLLK